MATANTIRNHTLTESESRLPPGEWVVRRGVRVFVPELPAVRFATPCHCGDYHAGICETCLAWAERDAERHSWEQRRRANRDHIWAILDARKRVAA